ncbi:Regulatory protein soxS [Anaerotruncus sp. 2789STDY5834896]|uniref:Regulatory protein soxS n=1 Tax=uncultured Anaerotruncus sp. TaxID=905011 RepID=A0A1C6JXI1_9FIRM|nr:Regulatory protein soxS [uncultured Anaerotruncus sp.]
MAGKTQNVMAAIDYIEAHLDQKLDLEQVAEAVHYSKYYLHRMFTAAVGLTVHDYVQRRQLTEAAKLLAFSRRPIAEIAQLAGYASQQAFTDAFKAMYKKAPGQFREEEAFYPLQLAFVLQPDPALPETDTAALAERVQTAQEKDIDRWMQLVRLVVDGFPGLIEEQYIDVLRDYMRAGRALWLCENQTAIGAVLFDPRQGSIDFLGVHPQYRRRGVTEALLRCVVERYMPGRPVSITTYRAGDRADTGYREAFLQLGFAESELLTEFGYPTQRFVLPAEERGGEGDD